MTSESFATHFMIRAHAHARIVIARTSIRSSLVVCAPQGRTENAAIVDCLEVDRVPMRDDAMAGYVGTSRVRELQNLLIMQAFSPALFCQGPSPGPATLMRLLRGEIQPEDVDEEFARLKRENQDSCVEKNLMKMPWECRACQMAGKDDYVKTMADFNVRCPNDFVTKLLPHGH